MAHISDTIVTEMIFALKDIRDALKDIATELKKGNAP